MKGRKREPSGKRHQLVVDLGYGERGLERRKAIEVAARAAGLTMAEWVRQVLFHSLGLRDGLTLTRSEFERLEERVRRLESMTRI